MKPRTGHIFVAPSFPDLTKPLRPSRKTAGWKCLDCPKEEIEGGAGWTGACDMANRHTKENEGHRAIVFTWRTQLSEGGLLRI